MDPEAEVVVATEEAPTRILVIDQTMKDYRQRTDVSAVGSKGTWRGTVEGARTPLLEVGTTEVGMDVSNPISLRTGDGAREDEEES